MEEELSTQDTSTLSTGTAYTSGDISDMLADPASKRGDLILLLRALAAKIRALGAPA